jgi:stress response protein YsnF
MFDSRAEADRAADILAQQGFQRTNIQIQSGAWSGSTAPRQEESQSWWDWLFGESEDRSYYTEGLQRGSAVLTVTVPEDRAEHAKDILESRGADVEESTSTHGTGATRGATAEPHGATAEPRGTGREEEVIPIVEEHVKVGKRPVARGVRVYSRISERPVEEQVTLRDEHVRIERRPADRHASAADEAFRDREIEVTETAEEPVVGKEARVVGEVVVGKESSERTETLRDKVRRTEVEVDKGKAPAGYEHVFQRHEDDFRRHWSTNLKNRGVRYEDCRNAYGYGCELGADPKYRGRDWSGLESEARSDWERRNPGTWDKYREPIRYSWDRVRQRAA